MRLNDLPRSPVVLADLLRNVGRWLDAHGVAHNSSARSAEIMNTPPAEIEAGLLWMDLAERDHALYQRAALREPLDRDFWNYADWPFDWKWGEDVETTKQNWNNALIAYASSLGWIAAPDTVFVQAATQLVRDIHEALERPDGPPAPAPPDISDWITCSKRGLEDAFVCGHGVDSADRLLRDGYILKYEKVNPELAQSKLRVLPAPQHRNQLVTGLARRKTVTEKKPKPR